MKLVKKKWVLLQACALLLFLLASVNLVRLALASNNPAIPDTASERTGRSRRSALTPLILATGQPAQGPELQVSLRYPELKSGEQQEFWLTITQSGIPIEGVQAQLTLILPKYLALNLFPLTSATGEAHLQINPLTEEPGSLIRYSVCLRRGEQNDCVWGEFVIADSMGSK